MPKPWDIPEYPDDMAYVYTGPENDEMISVRRGDLRAVLDVATQSMDFGSGFLDNEQVEILRKLAIVIGIDPLLATPSNFTCHYNGHKWTLNGKTISTLTQKVLGQNYRCSICHKTKTEKIEP